MRTAIGVVVLTACSFSGPGSPGAIDAADTPTIDGPGDEPDGPTAVIDAPVIDATPAADAAWCAVETDDTTASNQGQVGSNGGGQVGDISCDSPSDLIVGVAVEMSNQNTIFGGPSARGFRINCAPVAVITGGGAVVGAAYTREVRGSGAEDWSPSTWGAVTPCPDGWAFSGLDTHRGSSDNRWIDSTMQCAELAADGSLSGQRMTMFVDGTLDDNQNLDSEECGSAGIVRRLTPRTGSGLDAVSLICATTRCQ